jgi:serum/glucocorticoid-regulated kinase 2
MSPRNGLLLIRIVEARNLTIPVAALQQVQINVQNNSAASVQAAAGKAWWLPYVVLEFDRNELQIDALGGDLQNPVWKYRANLYCLPIHLMCG